MLNSQQLETAERILRRLRQRVFIYEDQDPEKGRKALRLIHLIKARCMPNWEERARPVADEWGATAADRAMLASHGMAWGD